MVNLMRSGLLDHVGDALRARGGASRSVQDDGRQALKSLVTRSEQDTRMDRTPEDLLFRLSSPQPRTGTATDGGPNPRQSRMLSKLVTSIMASPTFGWSP